MKDSELPAELISRLRADPAARGAFADQLLEAEDPRGELIAVQLELARGSKRTGLRARERALLQKHGKRWLAGFPKECTPSLVGGFISHLHVNPYLLAKGALEKAVALAPLLDSLELIAKNGGLVGVLRREELGEHRLGALAALEPALRELGPRLRTLRVSVKLLDPELEGLLALMPSLQVLDLRNNLIGFAGAKQLASFGGAVLRLGNNRLGAAGATALLAGPGAPAWRELDLSNDGVTVEGLAGLESLAQVEALDLDLNPLGLAGVRALCEAPLPRLTRLSLRRTNLEREGARLLATWRVQRPLVRLEVDDNPQLPARLLAQLTSGA